MTPNVSSLCAEGINLGDRGLTLPKVSKRPNSRSSGSKEGGGRNLHTQTLHEWQLLGLSSWLLSPNCHWQSLSFRTKGVVITNQRKLDKTTLCPIRHFGLNAAHGSILLIYRLNPSGLAWFRMSLA